MQAADLGFPLPIVPSSPSSHSPAKSPLQSARGQQMAKMAQSQLTSPSSPTKFTGTSSLKRALNLDHENVSSNIKSPHLGSPKNRASAVFESIHQTQKGPAAKHTQAANMKSPITVRYSVDFVKSDFFIHNGKEYPIQLIGEGSWHCVYKFLIDTSIELNGIMLSTKELIVKVPNQKKQNPSQLKKALKEDIIAYRNMLENNIPMPKCYVNPETFQDKVNPSIGGYWIFRKMSRSVTCAGWGNNASFEMISPEDQKLLHFVNKHSLKWLQREKKSFTASTPAMSWWMKMAALV